MADPNKVAYMRNIALKMQYLDTIFDEATDDEKEYFDMTYQGGGANAITDADAAIFNLTAANYTAAIGLIQQCNNLGKGLATTPADFAAVVNPFKRAPI